MGLVISSVFKCLLGETYKKENKIWPSARISPHASGSYCIDLDTACNDFSGQQSLQCTTNSRSFSYPFTGDSKYSTNLNSGNGLCEESSTITISESCIDLVVVDKDDGLDAFLEDIKFTNSDLGNGLYDNRITMPEPCIHMGVADEDNELDAYLEVIKYTNANSGNGLCEDSVAILESCIDLVVVDEEYELDARLEDIKYTNAKLGNGLCKDSITFSESFIDLMAVDGEPELNASLEDIKAVVLVEKLPQKDEGFGKREIVIREDYLIERPIKAKGQEEITRKGPYISSQKMLLVGEGDFSFSACLAVAFGTAANMVATSLDSTEFLCKNYKKAMHNILVLTSRGCKVMHGIDATKMASCRAFRAKKFDRIVFNFPHAGVFKHDGPRESQIRKHQKLVRMFLENARRMIKVDGEIHITHKCNSFFRDWKIPQLGANEGLGLVEAVHFNHLEYPGYSTKFGFGGDMHFNCNPSQTYKFGLT